MKGRRTSCPPPAKRRPWNFSRNCLQVKTLMHLITPSYWWATSVSHATQTFSLLLSTYPLIPLYVTTFLIFRKLPPCIHFLFNYNLPHILFVYVVHCWYFWVRNFSFSYFALSVVAFFYFRVTLLFYELGNVGTGSWQSSTLCSSRSE